ncbi:MAG: aminomethyl-transferring glycine dehydrogenase subunit GcvPB [Alphaproteobacteria bacterium]
MTDMSQKTFSMAEKPATHTGNRALAIEEPLIFEIGSPETSGVDFDEPETAASAPANRLGGLERNEPIGLPGLSEPQAVRHYVRLSQKNYSIDTGIFPLGSCTMKHNPRLNEKIARLPGFADVHPLQPQKTVQGAIGLMHMLGSWLTTLAGMPAVALSPKAGAHGELCGMTAIKAALEARDEADTRRVVLVPDSAHGTNPATAASLGFTIKAVPARTDGTVSAAAVIEALGPDVGAMMLTNPNTCGLFEPEIVEIADALHKAGAYLYCDGANFNAIAGRVRPGDLGVDAMHINLHKTFSTPHGGGGPGAGPVVFSAALAPYAPLPIIAKEADGEFRLIEDEASAADNEAKPFGRLTAFHGQMGMFVRALTFMLSFGADGIRQASEDAVLNANYVRCQLRDVMSQPFGDKTCMHEVLFDDSFLKDTGISTLDFAKAMIDEGFHPMTVYFPLVVHGAMLVEPTESESKASLDQFTSTLEALVQAAKRGEADRFREAPHYAPRKRLDETRAARKPVLRYSAQSVEKGA